MEFSGLKKPTGVDVVTIGTWVPELSDLVKKIFTSKLRNTIN